MEDCYKFWGLVRKAELYDKLEELECKLENIIGIHKHAGKDKKVFTYVFKASLNKPYRPWIMCKNFHA